MRIFSLIFLMLFLTVLGVFAYQNQEAIQLTFFDRQIDTNVAALAGAVYLLGMFSGWTVLGMLRRSFRRVTDEAEKREYQYR
jgi:putative membrane protein